MAYIKIVDEDAADGPLAREYETARRRAGKVYNIVRIQGHRPAALRASIGLYQRVMYGESGLTRSERELLAVVVSQANHCHY